MRLTAKTNNKRKTWNFIKKDTGWLHSVKEVRKLLVNDEKLKDATNVANAFNNSPLTIIGKFNIQQITKEDVNSILKDSFPGNFPSLKIIPITEAEIKSKIHSLKTK
jgi:hypothetical protein